MANRALPIYHDKDVDHVVYLQDMICGDCRLEECCEESLWCAFRWATNPNAAQLAVASFRLIPQRLTPAERSRRWRQKNRERYNEVQRNYRANKKGKLCQT